MFVTDRRTFLAGSLAAAAMPSRAAVLDPIEPSAIEGDLDLFAAAYRELHPGLARYLGRQGFDLRIERLRAWAATPRTLPELFVEFGRLTAAVRCGHSYPNPANQSGRVVQALFDGRDRIPFAFRWIGGRMVVTRPLRPDVELRPGTVIERVDGVRCAHLLRRLLPLARADGSNDGKRVALLAVDGTGRYGAFDVYRPLVGPTRGGGTIAVTVNGRTRLVPAMTEAERHSLPGGKSDPQSGWRFGIGADGIGILTMPTWAMYNSKWDWRSFLDDAVDRLIDGKARGLIIDLRNNEGGNDCGDVLVERLIDRALAKPAFERLVRYRRTPDAMRPILDTWDDSFHDWGDKLRPSNRPGYLKLVRDAEDEPGAALQPRGRRYDGPVVALISPTCSSATYQFAQMVKGSGRVTLIGETTGGNRRGINGGAYFFVRLPATGLEVDLPLIGYFPTTPQPDAGIEPDVRAAATVMDIHRGFDRALNVARQHLT